MSGAIRLKEHETREVALSPAEVAWLRCELQHAVDVWPTGEVGRYVLKAGSHVGFVSLSGGRTLVIEPKIPVETLFALLAAVYEPGHDVFREEWQDYATVAALFEFVVRVFAMQVEDLIARGLLHGYHTVTEDLTTVRGKLRLTETLRRWPGLHDRHTCAYSRFNADMCENRILRWAAFCLKVHRYRDVHLASRLHRIDIALSDVTLDPEARALFERVSFHRLNDAYRPALSLARLLLDHLTVTGTVGGQSFLAYLVDMNWLFERYLSVILKQAAAAWDLQVREQERHPFDTGHQVIVRPDVIVYRQGRPALVLDAKYKLSADQNDLYQVLAYCHVLGLDVGILVHPAHERAPRGVLTLHGQERVCIHYLALDLRGDPGQLQERGQALAGQVRELCSKPVREGQ